MLKQTGVVVFLLAAVACGGGSSSPSTGTPAAPSAPTPSPTPTSVSVTPATVFLGNISYCAGGLLSQTFQVTAPAGIPWSAGAYGDLSTNGYGISNVSPSTGVGSGSFTVTVSATPENVNGIPCQTTTAMSGSVVTYFTNGNPANDTVFVTPTWGLIT
jgi:hypothetical protein